MQTKTFTYKNATIAYKAIGSGTPVVLLHGFGEDSGIWEYQISFLQNHFLLIIPDIPGSGKSEYINDADIDTYAVIIKTMLDTEQIDQCVMIGHSMGGYITLAFAEKYPGYLKGFSLFHSSAFADSKEKKQAREKSIKFIQSNGAYNFLKTSIPGLFRLQEGPASFSNYINQLVEKSKNFTDVALIQYYNAMINRPDRTAVLSNSSVPVLFIIGEYDVAVPMQSSLQQCYLPSQSHIHIFNNSAHMSMIEETEKVNTVLFNYLTYVG